MTNQDTNWASNDSHGQYERPEKLPCVKKQIGKRARFLLAPVESESINQKDKESGLSKNLVNSWRKGPYWLLDDNMGKLDGSKPSKNRQNSHDSTNSTPQRARLEQNPANSALLRHDRMDLANYLTIIWRRKFVILITAAFTTIVVLAGIHFFPPPYESIATLRVASSRDGEVTYEEMLYVDRILRTYARVAASSSMEEEVTRRLGLTEGPEITAEVLPNTELLQIMVKHDDSDIARNAADTLTEMIVGENQQLGSRYNPITVVDRTTSPQDSAMPAPIIVLLGTFIGLVGGLGLAFLLENLDKTLYVNKQIETVSGLPTLGKIPKVSGKDTMLGNNDSSTKERPRHLIHSFHILRANILMQNSGKPLKSFLVVSADPKEGKSTIVANLASSIAQAGKKVVIIDGDLRRPKQHTIFQIPNDVGLSDLLGNSLELEQVLQKAEAGIDVITSGPLPDDPISLLNHEEVSDLMADLGRQYDYILVDAPAILAVPDAKLLACHVDGMILVVNRATSSADSVQSAIGTMKEMHAQPIGIVINRAEFKDGYYFRN